MERSPPTAGSVVIDPDEFGVGAAWSRHPTGRVRLALAAQDELSGVASVMVSNGVAGDETQVSIAPFIDHQLDAGADGLKTVSVRFCDRVGNCTQTPVTAQVRLDRLAPTAAEGYSVKLAGDVAVTNLPQAFIDLTLGGDAAAVRFGTTPSLAGASWVAVDGATTSAASFSVPLPLGDGFKTIYVQFSDAAGNLSTLEPAAFSVQIELDTVAPSGTVSIAGATRTNSRSVTLNLTRDFDVTRVAFGNDALDCASANYEPWPTSNKKAWTLTAGDGRKVVVACFRDAAGNASSASAAMTLDETPPQASATPAILVNGGARYATNAAVNLEFRVSGADTMRVSCDDALDSEPSQPFQPSLACVLNPIQGTRTVTAEFFDLAGNKLGPLTATILLDTVAPPSPNVLVVPTPTNLPQPQLRWTSGGQDSERFRLQVSSSSTFETTALDDVNGVSPRAWAAPEGTWFWRVAAIDAAGNQSSWSDGAKFRVDRTAPGAPGLSVLATSGNTVTVGWRTPGDDGANGNLAPGSKYDLWWMPGTLFDLARAEHATHLPTPGPLGTDETFVLEGLQPKSQYVLAIRACDAAGNCSGVSAPRVAITGDDTPPAAIADLAGELGARSVKLTWTNSADDGALGGGKVARVVVYHRAGPLETERDFFMAQQTNVDPGTPGTVSEHVIGGLGENTEYAFAVRSFDQAGNDSGRRTSLSCRRLASMKSAPHRGSPGTGWSFTG